MDFAEKYPNIAAALKTLAMSTAIGVVIGVAIAVYGNWRYNEGVEQGRAQHLCEVLHEWKINKLPQACENWISHVTPSSKVGE